MDTKNASKFRNCIKIIGQCDIKLIFSKIVSFTLLASTHMLKTPKHN